MPRVNCNYTNCYWNNAQKGSDVGRCINDEIDMVVIEVEDKEIEKACTSYTYQDKGEAFRRS